MDFINEELFKNDFGIYGIRNKINNFTYVGQTGENFQRRYWHHRWKLNNNSHDNQYLQNAWNKYGKDNFEFCVLEIVSDKDLLDDKEIEYIVNSNRKILVITYYRAVEVVEVCLCQTTPNN